MDARYEDNKARINAFVDAVEQFELSLDQHSASMTPGSIIPLLGRDEHGHAVYHSPSCSGVHLVIEVDMQQLYGWCEHFDDVSQVCSALHTLSTLPRRLGLWACVRFVSSICNQHLL